MSAGLYPHLLYFLCIFSVRIQGKVTPLFLTFLSPETPLRSPELLTTAPSRPRAYKNHSSLSLILPNSRQGNFLLPHDSPAIYNLQLFKTHNIRTSPVVLSPIKCKSNPADIQVTVTEHQGVCCCCHMNHPWLLTGKRMKKIGSIE